MKEKTVLMMTVGAGVGNPRGDMPDVRFGLEEQDTPTYSKSERILFENTNKVRRLVEQMKKKEASKDET
jgi:hypothetical protein